MYIYLVYLQKYGTLLRNNKMASIRFQLLYPQNKEKIQSVYMIIGIGDSQRIRIRVPNIKIHPSQWDKSKQRVKLLKEIETKHELNSIIDEMEYKVKKTISEIERKRPPATYDKINEAVKKIYPSNRLIKHLQSEKKAELPVNEKVTFWLFAEKFLKDLSVNVNEKGMFTNTQTIKNYKSVINCLKEFESKYNKSLDFHSFDAPLIIEYKSYLTTEKQHKPNTIDKKIRTINNLLETAYENGLHDNTAYKTRKEFRTKAENVENIYLTEDELVQIEKYDFSSKQGLDNVRDWFLIACWTGLRYSDLGKLKKELIKDYTIILEQKKTKQEVKVVLNFTSTIPKILAKRNGDFPKLITNQKFNKYVKEVLELVGINEPTTKNETIGGKRVSKIVPKYELVSTHTARRTFATNLYLRKKIPISVMMAATGHKTEEQFMKYIKLSQIEKQGDLKSYME